MEKPHQEFRLLDQLAVAWERGERTALQSTRINFPRSAGVLVECSVLSDAIPAVADALDRHADPFLNSVDNARSSRNTLLTGTIQHSVWGAMCLSRTQPSDFKERLFEFELAARKAMAFKRNVTQAKANICGALQELVDNIFEHSEKPETGVIAFIGKAESFELSIGDGGIGVLASLRSNPAYSFLTDSTAALSFALTDGNSRFGRSAGRGNGFTTLFRALRTLDADLRFRSGDCALQVNGRAPALSTANTLQKAHLQGFVVSLKLRL